MKNLLNKLVKHRTDVNKNLLKKKTVKLTKSKEVKSKKSKKSKKSHNKKNLRKIYVKDSNGKKYLVKQGKLGGHYYIKNKRKIYIKHKTNKN